MKHVHQDTNTELFQSLKSNVISGEAVPIQTTIRCCLSVLRSTICLFDTAAQPLFFFDENNQSLLLVAFVLYVYEWRLAGNHFKKL